MEAIQQQLTDLDHRNSGQFAQLKQLYLDIQGLVSKLKDIQHPIKVPVQDPHKVQANHNDTHAQATGKHPAHLTEQKPIKEDQAHTKPAHTQEQNKEKLQQSETHNQQHHQPEQDKHHKKEEDLQKPQETLENKQSNIEHNHDLNNQYTKLEDQTNSEQQHLIVTEQIQQHQPKEQIQVQYEQSIDHNDNNDQQQNNGNVNHVEQTSEVQANAQQQQSNNIQNHDQQKLMHEQIETQVQQVQQQNEDDVI